MDNTGAGEASVVAISIAMLFILMLGGLSLSMDPAAWGTAIAIAPLR